MSDLRQFEYCALVKDAGPHGCEWVIVHGDSTTPLPDGQSWMQACNRLGASGWEAVGVSETLGVIGESSYTTARILFKRER